MRRVISCLTLRACCSVVGLRHLLLVYSLLGLGPQEIFSFSGVAFGSGGPVGLADVLVDFGSFFCGRVDRALGCIGSLPWSVLPYAGLCDLTKEKKKLLKYHERS